MRKFANDTKQAQCILSEDVGKLQECLNLFVSEQKYGECRSIFLNVKYYMWDKIIPNLTTILMVQNYQRSVKRKTLE